MKEIWKAAKLFTYSQNFKTNLKVCALYIIIGTVYGMMMEQMAYCAMWYAFPCLMLLMDGSNVCVAQLVQSSPKRRTLLLKSSMLLLFAGVLLLLCIYFIVGALGVHIKGVSFESVMEGALLMLLALPLLIIYNALTYRWQLVAYIVLGGMCIGIVTLTNYGGETLIRMPAFLYSFPLFILFCIAAAVLISLLYFLVSLLTYRISYSPRVMERLFRVQRSIM